MCPALSVASAAKNSVSSTGTARRYAVNLLGQTTLVTDTLGRMSRNGYDGTGALRWTRRNDGQLTIYQIDGLGRTLAAIVNYQDGVVSTGEPTDRDLISRIVYDEASRRTQTTDPAGRITTFAYDNLDQLIGVTENVASGTCPKTPCNVMTQYQYDRAGNRTRIIDPLGHARTFSYDAADQQTQVIDALSRITSWQYDAGRRVSNQTDPRGSNYNLTFTYDGLDRLTQTSATNLDTISASYDALGRRTSLNNGTGTTTFTPDALGRITQIAAPSTGAINYSYDGRGARTKVVYPTAGTTLNYSYFADGRLQQVTQGTTNPVMLATYGYDAASRLQSVTRTNGANTTYTYDGADRLRDVRTTVGTNDVSRFQYDTDRIGLRSVVTETVGLRAPSGVTFVAAVNAAAGTNARAVATGDLNRDGKPDLVVANGGSTNVSVDYRTENLF